MRGKPTGEGKDLQCKRVISSQARSSFILEKIQSVKRRDLQDSVSLRKKGDRKYPSTDHWINWLRKGN